jgi:hypothetical protein
MKTPKSKDSAKAKKLSVNKETLKDLQPGEKGNVKGGLKAVFTDACITKDVSTTCCPLKRA